MDLRAIFLTGVEIAEPEKRQAFVEEACGSNADLRDQVESLFRAHDRHAHDSRHPTLQQAAPAARLLGQLGHFRLLEVLGRGGMGMVYLAEDQLLNRKVAVKVLLPMAAASPSAHERFLREAKAAAALESDYVVPVYQVGDDHGIPYLVMPFLKGQSLDHWMAEGAGCPLPRVLQVGQQVARGLAAAHAKGLIHRDIKPANIWLEACTGRAKILDFGLAQATEDTTPLTDAGLAVGTPGYMAPEQARGEKVDPRTDLFSLGAVLYRLCTGEPPFRGRTPSAALMALESAGPPPAHELNPLLPRSLSDLVMRLLAKPPAERPASAREVLERLQAIERELSGQPLPGPLAIPEGALDSDASWESLPTAPWKAARAEPDRPSERPITTSSRPWAIAALAVVVSIGLLAAGLAFPAGNRTGTLVVNVPEPDVQFFLDGELRQAPGSSRTVRLDLPSGNHTLIVKRGEEVLYTEPFTLEADRETVVNATWSPRRYTNSLGMEFALVPKGTFWMGGRAGQPGDREVTLPHDFYLGVYEVTQEEWEKVMGKPNEHGHFTRSGKDREAVKHVPDADLKRFPVDTVSWEDCQRFLVRLNEKLKENGWAYRLPREAEWEYACRGGPLPGKEDYGYDYYTGSPTNTLLPERANFAGSGLKRTCKVGSYPPNRLGLHDMHGNVFEVCEDSLTDGLGNPLMPLMGGGWIDPAGFCRVSGRGLGAPTARFNGSGLRVARVPLGKDEK